MAATPHLPDPQPGEPRPLSAHEQQALSELEARTVHQDPALSLRMGRTRARWHDRLSPRAYNAIVQAGVVFVVAIVLLPRPWAGALIALAAMLVPAVIAFVAIRRDGS